MSQPSFSAEDYSATPVSYSPLEVIDLVALSQGDSSEYENLVINRINQHCLRLAVFDGTYPWHHHPDSDEMFLVLQGCLIIDLPDGRQLRLGPGQAATVPAGMVHQTRTEGRTVNLCFEALAAATVFVESPLDPSS